jgi:hypothetical protein
MNCKVYSCDFQQAQEESALLPVYFPTYRLRPTIYPLPSPVSGQGQVFVRAAGILT